MKERATHKKLTEGKSCVALAKQDKPKSEHPNDEKTKRTQMESRHSEITKQSQFASLSAQKQGWQKNKPK
jgi:hypothetical protein